MSVDFIPAGDESFANWARTLSTGVSEDPESVGLDSAIAATLATKYSAFDAALSAALAPETRGGSTILAKSLARKDLENFCREVARQIQGTISVTDQQRYDLGLTVPVQRSDIPRPGFAPKLDFVSMDGHVMTFRAHDVNSPKRGRPAGVTGMSVFSYAGENPPTDISKWVFESSTNKTLVEIHFDPELAPGTKVWVTAYWTNAKLESGPATTPPLAAVIQYGGMTQTA